MSFFKQKPLRSAKHIRRIKTLPCMLCGVEPCGDPQHLKRAEPIKGIARTLGDNWALPHCRGCHTKAETWPMGEVDFYESHGWPYERVMEVATELWEGTHPPVSPDRGE